MTVSFILSSEVFKPGLVSPGRESGQVDFD